MTADRIDVHAHYTGGSVREVFDSGFTLTGGFKMSSSWTPERALDLMDRQGIATQVLSVPWTFAGTDDDPDFARRLTRRVNLELAKLIEDYPGRFGAFAALPGDSSEAMIEEASYALDDLHLDGVMLNSNILGRYLGEDWAEPLLAELARRRVPVFIHPIDSPTIAELGFGRPSSVCEFPFDTARTVINAIYRGVFQRHPGLTLILAHCGGALPTLGWRIGEHSKLGQTPQDAGLTADQVAAVLQGLYYETALAASRNSLLPALEVADSSHILFGSDWPAAPEGTVAKNTDQLLGGGVFTSEQLRGVERDNALSLFPRLA
ncbi:amidohydrolase family protein [Streptomyces sp. NPDC127036]|uniref:amidohydrolase family protein n=1 Tax=Streptomyces sp. NPDC127036 TaxID=3347112 RepID=UPI0036562220